MIVLSVLIVSALGLYPAVLAGDHPFQDGEDSSFGTFTLGN
jgi:hypothetical protein